MVEKSLLNVMLAVTLFSQKYQLEVCLASVHERKKQFELMALTAMKGYFNITFNLELP